MNVSKTLRKFWSKNNQKIMTIVCSGSTVLAVCTAVEAGPKFKEVAENREIELSLLKAKRATKGFDKKSYIPKRMRIELDFARDAAVTLWKPILFTAISLGSGISGYKMALSKEAALTAYSLSSEIALKDFMEKTKEVVGDKKYDEIRSEIAKDAVASNPPPEDILKACKEQQEVRDTNDLLVAPKMCPCLDTWSGKYFVSSRNVIDAALNRVAANARRGKGGGEYYEEVSMNDIYEELHLMRADIGDTHGFSSEDLTRNHGDIPVHIEPVEDDLYGVVLAITFCPDLL